VELLSPVCVYVYMWTLIMCVRHLADIKDCVVLQELGSGGKKADAGEDWRQQSVEYRLEYALVRV